MKNTKMPDEIKIDGCTYEVNHKDQVIHEGQTIYGRISSKESVIEVSKDICEYQQKATLAHEVIHGIFSHRNIEKHISKEHYEDITDELAKGLIQIIRDNPEFVEYIRN